MKWILIYLISLMLTGCQSTDQQSMDKYWHNIKSRDSSTFVYRAKVPSYWICRDPDPSQDLRDTTQAICELFITNQDGEIRLTVHSFPYHSTHSRIPPGAQIARWKKQFSTINELKTTVTACSYNGFHGLYLECEGEQKNQALAVMGWSLQLAQFYDQQLDLEKDALKRADYTIKAVGPPTLMHQYRAEIIAFAESFELIDELPIPL